MRPARAWCRKRSSSSAMKIVPVRDTIAITIAVLGRREFPENGAVLVSITSVNGRWRTARRLSCYPGDAGRAPRRWTDSRPSRSRAFRASRCQLRWRGERRKRGKGQDPGKLPHGDTPSSGDPRNRIAMARNLYAFTSLPGTQFAHRQMPELPNEPGQEARRATNRPLCSHCPGLMTALATFPLRSLSKVIRV